MPRSFLVKKAERVKVDKTLFCDTEDDEDDEGTYEDGNGYHADRISGFRVGDTGSRNRSVTTTMTPYPPALQPLVVRLANGK